MRKTVNSAITSKKCLMGRINLLKHRIEGCDWVYTPVYESVGYEWSYWERKCTKCGKMYGRQIIFSSIKRDSGWVKIKETRFSKDEFEV